MLDEITVTDRSSFPYLVFYATKFSSHKADFSPMNENGVSAVIQSQRILDHLADGIIYCNQNGVITYTNKAANALVGRPAGELLEQPITDILTRLPLLAATSESAKVGKFELNGRYVRGQATTLYDRDNQVQGILTTLHDITAEFEAEKSKDSFLQTISHELRTPLTAIKGYIELLSRDSGGTLSSDQKLFTMTIQRNVNRMVQLINSLIFASSIRSGRLEYISGHTDLSQLIPQIGRELQPRAAEDGQKIKIKIGRKLQPLQVDPIHMATILEELISNSIKFNRPGGEVRITATAKSGGKNKPENVVVSVSDDGIGIAPDDQDQIFEEFYRADDETDTQIRARGMGMGLSIVKAIVEAYNGRIWIDSAPNQGSTFTFTIPNLPVEPNTPLSLSLNNAEH